VKLRRAFSAGASEEVQSLLNHHRDVGDGIFNTAEANEYFAGTAQCNNDDNDEFENFGMRGEEAEDALKNNGITQVENINRAAPATEGDGVAVEDDEIYKRDRANVANASRRPMLQRERGTLHRTEQAAC
jgi:hypothetical protein